MANNPRAFDTRLREEWQRAYAAAPLMSAAYPGVAALQLQLNFLRSSGLSYASPYSRLFVPEMQAHFAILCPDRQCSGGGFDLGEAVGHAIGGEQWAENGVLSCGGRAGGEDCGISLRYRVDVRHAG